MNEINPSRRALLSVGMVAAAGACVPFGKTSPFWGTIAKSVESQSGSPVDRTYTDSLPYASMLAWFDGAAPALIILAEIASDNRLVWLSAERQSITTYGPFVISALGFDLELRGTRFDTPWRRNPLDMLDSRRFGRTLDVAAESNRVQVALTSRFERRAVERVEILGVAYELQHVVEKVSSGGRPRYKNHYWVDDSGRTWKSRQTVVPTLPVFNTEILKYPSAT